MENVNIITSNNIKRDKEWYFSEEGRIAYEQADSIANKIEYFYNYLSLFSDAGELTYKLACLLASGIANSNLSFSQYPEILSKKSNPFIKHYINEGFLGNEYNACELVECLHEQSDYPNKKRKATSDYDAIMEFQMPEDIGMEDIYVIERLIIWLFGEFVSDSELADEPVIKYYPYTVDDSTLHYNDPNEEELDDDEDY